MNMAISEQQPQETLQGWVYRQLREAIMTGYFIPGRSVTLRGVAAELNVSPMPVREALQRLVAERALEGLNNRRVAVPRMTQSKLEELCEARVALETAAAERALTAIDEKCLEHLRRLNADIDAAVAAGHVDVYLEKQRTFHFTLYNAAPSQVLVPLIESVWLQTGPFMRMVLDHIDSSYPVDRHVEILDAIAKQDARSLSFAIEADIRDGMSGLNEAEWQKFYE